jgi:hypothetical protein
MAKGVQKERAGKRFARRGSRSAGTSVRGRKDGSSRFRQGAARQVSPEKPKPAEF